MDIKLTIQKDGNLLLDDGHQHRTAFAVRCFPWTAPNQFISLRDDSNQELAFIENVEQLSPASMQALNKALHTVSFVIRVVVVLSIDSEFEIRQWRVKTPQGEHVFQTKMDEWPRLMHDGGLLVNDVSGNVIKIDDPKTMDAKSRRCLWPYLA